MPLWRHDRPVAVTEDAGRFPFSGEVPPDDQELGFAETLVGLQVAELVPALLDRTKILDGENLETAGDQLAPEMSAHVLFRIGEVGGTRPGYATLVVIELKILRQVARVLLQPPGGVAMIEGIEQAGIQAGNRPGQRNLFGGIVVHA